MKNSPSFILHLPAFILSYSRAPKPRISSRRKKERHDYWQSIHVKVPIGTRFHIGGLSTGKKPIQSSHQKRYS
jgi:hypothetical protein